MYGVAGWVTPLSFVMHGMKRIRTAAKKRINLSILLPSMAPDPKKVGEQNRKGNYGRNGGPA
jgi:hypothetical protein